MDAIEILEQQHKEVKALFKQVEETEDEQQALKLYQQVSTSLQLHEDLEETLLYPALKKDEDTREITLEAYQEHHVADVLMREIGNLQPGSEAWKPKVTVLQENIEHHIEEEEGELFPMVRQKWSTQRLSEIGQQMQAMMKERAKKKAA